MKFRKMLYIVPASVMLLAGTSCVGDLNVDPTIDKSTLMSFDRDQNFNKIYANMALTGQQGPAGMGDIADIDEGTSDFFRQIWQMNELPTDEAICCWSDPGVPEYNFGTWDASHGMVTALYYRLYFGITLSNFYLQQTQGDVSAEAVKQRAEARFLRAMYYYYAMDFFGNVPFLTTLSSENAPQAKRAEVFKFIEDELIGENGCIKDMAEPKTNAYGRADKAAGWLLLSRLYLNAAVYTGTAQWEKAAEYADKVINSGYTLASNYRSLFMGDNSSNGAQNEIILPILQDGIKTQNYGGAMFLIGATHKNDMGATGTSENWAGMRARKDLVKKFFPSSDPQNVETGEMVKAAKDDRALLYGKDRNLEVKDIATFTDGFSVDKFTNVYASGELGHDNKFVDMDIPFMRLAEAYLTYAEAELRLGKKEEAKTALDALRKRAKASTQPEYSLDDVCDEWAKEFMFEGRRRIDLVRFGKFGGNTDYVWEWKGGVKAGTTIPATRNIYAIPTKDIVANSNLKQNTGY